MTPITAKRLREEADFRNWLYADTPVSGWLSREVRNAMERAVAKRDAFEARKQPKPRKIARLKRGQFNARLSPQALAKLNADNEKRAGA